MVLQFTDGRTSSLRAMKQHEFDEMCDALAARKLEENNYYEQQLRKARSSVLLRINRLGISTLDNWDEVNAFLMSPKIAGKLLYEMNLEELKALVKKLEAIARNGGLKSKEEVEQDARIRQKLLQLVSMPAASGNKSKFLS